MRNGRLKKKQMKTRTKKYNNQKDKNTIQSQRQNQVYGGKHRCLDNRLIKLSILINQKNNTEKPEQR